MGPSITVITGATDIILSGNSTCAAYANGPIACWGWPNASTSPTCLNITPGIRRLPGSLFAYTEDGRLANWPSTAPSDERHPSHIDPVFTLHGLDDVTHGRGGASQGCVRKNDSSVWCWGTNTLFELGVITVGSSANPLLVPDANDALAIAGAGNLTCAIRANGK